MALCCGETFLKCKINSCSPYLRNLGGKQCPNNWKHFHSLALSTWPPPSLVWGRYGCCGWKVARDVRAKGFCLHLPRLPLSEHPVLFLQGFAMVGLCSVPVSPDHNTATEHGSILPGMLSARRGCSHRQALRAHGFTHSAGQWGEELL